MNIKYNTYCRVSAPCGWSLKAVLIGVCALGAVASAADPVAQAVDAAVAGTRADKASQERVNQTDDQTRALLERYRNALWQSQQLTVYAQQLDQLASAQDSEKQSLERQIAEIDRTERELLPLMLRMVDTLEKFVAADLPFLKDERKERVANLKRLMGDPEAGVAEKYRRILEAYQIEADYGRSFGAERGEVAGRTVDVLRVGRTALYALAMDGSEAQLWNAEKGEWQPLDRRYVGNVRQGLKIARETTAADLLVLPVAAAKGATP